LTNNRDVDETIKSFGLAYAAGYDEARNLDGTK
jgi:hypothetical protein